MSRESKSRMRCDHCGDTSPEFWGSDGIPKGWGEYRIETGSSSDGYGISFYNDRVLCDACYLKYNKTWVAEWHEHSWGEMTHNERTAITNAYLKDGRDAMHREAEKAFVRLRAERDKPSN